MAAFTYKPVSQVNSSFGQPRQKQWVLFKRGDMGWAPDMQSTSLPQIRARLKSLIDGGGMSMSLDRLIVAELVPIDTLIVPTV